MVGAIRARGAIALVVVGAAACGPPPTRPQVAVESTGDRHAPLPASAPVRIVTRGEPQSSFREIGRVTSSCPVRHWQAGREVRGRPICIDGLRQGARMLGGEAVIEVRARRFTPEWSPGSPWIIMRGVVIRMVY